MLTTKAGSRIKVYYEVTKPKIWYLLVFTAIGAAVTASNLYHIPISPLTWSLLVGSVIAGSAAAKIFVVLTACALREREYGNSGCGFGCV
ncbi:MAG: hypothetical protein P4K92_07830 [Candidatus Nitrosotalea sp.]|nr:hypothetical protein [Candidatus Nitrosotalea sp.]